MRCYRDIAPRKNRIDYRQSGSLQLFSSLKTGCTRSLPQILLPALLGCLRKSTVPLSKISINRLLAFFNGSIVAVVEYGFRHAAKN